MKKSCLLTVLLLAGCSSAPPLFTSDGRPTSVVRCGSNLNDCQMRADALCGAQGAYDVLQRNSDDQGQSMLIACHRQRQ